MTDYLVNIMSASVAIEYIDHGFEKRFVGWKRYLILILGCVSYFLVVTGLNMTVKFEGFLGLSYGGLLFLYGKIALKAKTLELGVLSLAWVLIAVVSAYMLFGSIGIITGLSLEMLLESSGSLRTYSALAALVLKFSMGRFVQALYGRKSQSSDRVEDWIMAGTFLLMFILVLGMFRLEEGALDQQSRYILSLGLLGGVFGIVLMLGSVYRRLEDYRRKEQENEYQKQNQAKQEEQIQELYHVCREVNRLRHDLQAKLSVLNCQLRAKKYEDARQSILMMESELGEYGELPHDTGNEGLNAALMKAGHACKKHHIKFHYALMGNLKSAHWITSIDMGNLLYNLLMNGVEANEHVPGDRQLNLIVRAEKKEIEIQIENTIEKSVLEHNPGFKSQKKDQHHHGLGLVSIRKIIEKHNGVYSCWEEDGQFVQRIILRSEAGVSNQ